MDNYKKISFTYDEEQRIEVDKILKLSPKVIKKKFGWDDNYYQQIKRLFTKQKNNGYKVIDDYRDKGNKRVFGKSTTLQSVDNKILSNLFSKNTYDIDMKNASFRIIKHILTRKFEDKVGEFPLLIDYAENRENYYSNLCDKQFFISSIFCHNPLFKINASYSKKVNDLLKEISQFQKLCSANLNLWNCDFNPDNHIGKNVCQIIFYYENKLLQEIIPSFSQHIKYLKFDGFGISNDCDLENLLSIANKCGDKYGIEILNKEFPPPILLDEPPMYAVKEDIHKDAYDAMKIVFEENHFIIKNPLTFYEIYEGKEIAYNKQNFLDVIATYQIDDEPFFYRWLKDENRREYQSYIWTPILSNNIDSVNYNSFKGFDIEKYGDEYIDKEIVNEFLEKLILLLVGNEKNAQQYIIKFIAHMIQHPELLAKTALVFKGKQGVGKDLFMDILEGIIGVEYIHRDGKMENISGTFNTSLKNKLIVQLNEVSGKDGHFNKETLKDLITVDRLNIREMRKDVETVKNYMRLFLFTNNINAIDIPFDDRRYCVFKTGEKQERTYYDTLHDIKKNKSSLKSLYNYFKNYDLGDFTPDDPKDRVITLAYTQLQNTNRKPFYQFLRDFLEDEIKEFQYIPKKNLHYIKMKTIENHYNSWLYIMDYDTVSFPKVNKSIMTELGALEVRAKIGNQPTTRYFSLVVKDMITKLDIEHKFVKPEIINI